jgi:predicted AlkP superfamily pyrophosphatase or phosphodiesterase
MKKTVVINVVGLTRKAIGQDMPFLAKYLANHSITPIKPIIPAVTCSMQATYLTGKLPSEHGIVGNGWYDQEECEIKFWKQSNKLVQSPKIWEVARQADPTFTCANMFWWYNMYSSVDYSVTPRPNYLADGQKIPDCYTYPPELRDELQKEFGQFPLFDFWGPKTSIKSSRWIAEASKFTDKRYDPTLTLIYLPHLDYNYQRYGTNHPTITEDLKDMDDVCKDLIQYYEKQKTQIILLSEYGITDVNQPIHLNRVLRKKGYLSIRTEQTWELLDAGASKAFAVADHQIAHIYINDKSETAQIKKIIESVEGVEKVWDENDKAQRGLEHPRAGDLIAVADKNSWFTYYYWLEDEKAPDFARMVDIHRKPGYDPVEMFIDPAIKMQMLTIGTKLLKKKMGFRTVMDIIPLDATLVKGSHGRIPESLEDYPVFITAQKDLIATETLEATQVFDLIWRVLKGE